VTPDPRSVRLLGGGGLLGAALYARRAFAQATLDELALQLNDLVFLGVCVTGLLILLVFVGAAIYGRQR